MAVKNLKSSIKKDFVDQIFSDDLVFCFGAWTLFLILSLRKMQVFILEGRFWAEEGAIFFHDISKLNSFARAMSYQFHGHVELVTNFIIWLATKVNLQFAPLVTTYASFAFQAIPVVMVLACRQKLGLSKLNGLLFIVVIVGLAQSAEVWANTINLHFHFTVLAALIAVCEPKNQLQIRGSYILLAVSGLSGIPANFLAPIFLIKALLSKNRVAWIHFFILVGTSLIQITLLFVNDLQTGSRQIAFSPLITLYAIVAQQVWSPFAGIKIFEKPITILRAGIGGDGSTLFYFSLFLAIFSAIPIAYAFKVAIRDRLWVVICLISCAIFIALMSIVTAIGDKVNMVSVLGSGRYFFASNFLTLLAFFIVVTKYRDWRLRLCAVVLVISCWSRIGEIWHGPPWGASLREATAADASHIKIWPTGWLMRNPLKQ